MFAEDKKPVNDIAFELRLSPGLIRSWKKRDRWSQRIQVAKANPQMGHEEIVTLAKRDDLDLEIPPELAERQTEYQDKLGAAAIRLANHIENMDGDELVQKADKISKADAVARKALKLETEKPHSLINLAVLCQPAPNRTADPNVELRYRKC
jgi:Phage terminase small subunit